MSCMIILKNLKLKTEKYYETSNENTIRTEVTLIEKLLNFKVP